MELIIKGRVIKAGATKTGKFFCTVLVERPDGQEDTVTMWSEKEHKHNEQLNTRASAWVQQCNEIVTASPDSVGAKK